MTKKKNHIRFLKFQQNQVWKNFEHIIEYPQTLWEKCQKKVLQGLIKSIVILNEFVFGLNKLIQQKASQSSLCVSAMS